MKNKNHHLSTLMHALLFGAALFAGMRIADAARIWVDPTSTPTGGNLSIPLHTGAGRQVKVGGLALNTFLATKNAQFDQQVFFRKAIHGGTPTMPGTLMIGGTDTSGASYRVAATVSADVHADGTLGAAELSNTTNSKVCGDTAGHVTLCSDSAGTPVGSPKDVYGSVTERCVNGDPKIDFSFTAPTPVSFDMKLAMCTATFWYSSKVSCWGTDLLNTVGEQRPWASPSGTGSGDAFYSRPTPFSITIPAGVTSYTVSNLQQNGEKAFCRQSGSLIEGIQYTYGSQYTSPTYYTLVMKMLTNTDYTLYLTGKTMFNTAPKYNLFTPIVIK